MRRSRPISRARASRPARCSIFCTPSCLGSWPCNARTSNARALARRPMPEVNLVEAVRMALGRAMADDPSVLVLGEDVGVDGGVFRATEGVLERFGPQRGFDTPLS